MNEHLIPKSAAFLERSIEEILYFSIDESLQKPIESNPNTEHVGSIPVLRNRLSEDFRREILSKEKRQMYIDLLQKFEKFDSGKVDDVLEVEGFLLEAGSEIKIEEETKQEEFSVDELNDKGRKRRYSFDTGDIQTILYTTVIHKTIQSKNINLCNSN
jgi:hypothetical protein